MFKQLLLACTVVAVISFVVIANQVPPQRLAQFFTLEQTPKAETTPDLKLIPEILLPEDVELKPAVLSPNQEMLKSPKSHLHPVNYGKIKQPEETGTVEIADVQNSMTPNLMVESLMKLEDELDDEVNDIRVLLIPDRETTIASNTAGRLVSLRGKLGERFQAGDLLASFDCDAQQAQLEINQAELSGAMDQHEAKIKMQGLDQASDLEVALAASEVNRVKAELKLNQTVADECKIYAPWSGRVAKAHVKKYMTVAAGEPLLDIVNNGRLKIKLNVPSSNLSKLKVGRRFNVSIDETNRKYSAKISRINSKVDPVSQTVEIEATLIKHYSKLLAGMSGTADLGLSAKNNKSSRKIAASK